MQFELFNFNHPYKKAINFQIGPFEITITDEHCANISKLPTLATDTYTHDENFQRIVESSKPEKGNWIPTAYATIDDSKCIQSVIESDSDRKIDYDLCILLSFVTGTRVAMEKDLDRHILSPGQGWGCFTPHLHLFGSRAWNGLSNIASNKIGAQFINLTYANEKYEFLGWCSYVTSTLNVIVDKWWSKNKLRFVDKNCISTIKKKLSQHIEQSIVIKAKLRAINMLNDSNQNLTAKDLSEKFVKLFDTSAHIKNFQFCIDSAFFPPNPEKEVEERLKLLNKIRNGIVHSGDISAISKYSIDKSREIAINVMTISFEICRYWFANLIDIPPTIDPTVLNKRNEIVSFFTSGIFRGHNVFEEDFDQYMTRIAGQWINNGVSPH